MNYYILCPWGETGGPEGLHQLCYELVNLGINSKIVYYHPWTDRIESEHDGKVCGRYNQYTGVESHTPNNISELDDSNNVIVLPEICRARHIEIFKNAKVVFLRLSNNTKESAPDPINYDSICDPVFKTCYTGCDSSLIYKKIKETKFYDMSKVFMLTPNINLSHIREEKDLKNVRENVVLYNPAKGNNHIQKILEISKKIDLDIDIEFFPLRGMSQDELKDKIYASKVYVDFGHFPGKDRLSREAASGGCVVLLGKRGSGSDWDDFQVEEKVDWDASNDSFDYESICKIIIDMINNYNYYFEKQKSYREIIRKERSLYIEQVKDMVKILETQI